MDPSVRKTLAAETLVESGLLFEINRRVLHPIGLALVVEKEGTGLRLADWLVDCRDDPQGIVFDEEALLDGFRKLGAYMRESGFKSLAKRYNKLRFRCQNVVEVYPFADESEWKLPDDVYPVNGSPASEGIPKDFISAFGTIKEATRSLNRFRFFVKRAISTKDHLTSVAAVKLLDDFYRVGRRLARLEAAIDEVDVDLSGELDVGVRVRIEQAVEE